MNRLSNSVLASALVGALSLGLIWATAAQSDSRRHFTVDVAMDRATNGANLPDVGVPGRALVGIFNGNIYPRGTLRRGDATFDPTSDGDIGTWRCHFTGLNDVASATGSEDSLDYPLTGAVTYYFQFKRTGYERADSILVVMGLNSHTFNDDESVRRVFAIVGGTGKFAGASGTVRETVLGRNITGSRNLRFRIRLDKGGHHKHHDDD